MVKILVSRERLRGWKLDRMGDVSMGVKLLAEQMCSELKASGRTCPNVNLTVHLPSFLILLTDDRSYHAPHCQEVTFRIVYFTFQSGKTSHAY